jgi:hypothetical protein
LTQPVRDKPRDDALAWLGGQMPNPSAVIVATWTSANDPRIQALKQSLLGNLIPDVLRAPLPGALRVAQTASRVAYLAYDALLQNLQNNSCGGNSPSSTGDLPAQLPFGKDF